MGVASRGLITNDRLLRHRKREKAKRNRRSLGLALRENLTTLQARDTTPKLSHVHRLRIRVLAKESPGFVGELLKRFE